MTNDTLRFIYRDARGRISARELSDFSQSEEYIQGYSTADGEFRTFRKDRVLEQVADAASLQQRLDFHAANAPPPLPDRKRNPDRLPEICFTGFKKEEKGRLVAIAQAAGMYVRPSVTRDLMFLCCGDNAGPKKLAKARKLGVILLTAAQFTTLAETGEVPDDE
jgi:NAD-dependent DNA ligase